MSSHDVLVTLGANNKDRSKNDLYVTSDVAIDGLLDREQFNKDVWECACGLGNISEKLKTKKLQCSIHRSLRLWLQVSG